MTLSIRTLLILLIGIAVRAQDTPAPVAYPPLPAWGRQLIDALQIKQGSTLVDVGAGKGTFVRVWSLAVGPTGRVIAEDIDKPSLDRARKTAEDLKLTNVEFVLGSPRDPSLADACADLIVIMDAYHEFQLPEDMLAHVSRALKPHGRLAIIDFYKPAKWTVGFPPPWHIRLDKADAINEIESLGFHLISSEDYLGGKQYIAIFGYSR